MGKTSGMSSAGSSHKGKSMSSVETAYKTRGLLTRGEKLIVLRNALFDDDEGGFGAERDVTRWLAPAFRSYNKNGMDLSIEFAHGESLIGDDLADLVDLAAVFSEEVEQDAGREYHADDKEEHLTEDAARFLIVRDTKGKIVAFAHFRFTLHGELADCMEGQPCLFVYDIHVDEAIKRKGVAKHLMVMLELIARKANLYEMVMPIPNSTLADDSKVFMNTGLKGWSEDDLSEIAPKTSRALVEDGSMLVFVKILKPREVEEEEEEVPVQSEKATDEQSTSEEASEDDWGIPSETTPANAKKNKNKGGKKKKGGKNKQVKDTAEPIVGACAAEPILIE